MGVQPSRRTRTFLTRAVASTVVAFIVVLSANVAGPQWFDELVRWLQPAPRAALPHPTARSGPIGAPVTVTPMRPEGNDSSVSPVPLPLILVRTHRGRNSREGFAEIGVRARSPQTYTAGALLANGARLTEIYDHYVVLERGGRSARLYVQGEAQPDGKRARELLTVGGTPVVRRRRCGAAACRGCGRQPRCAHGLSPTESGLHRQGASRLCALRGTQGRALLTTRVRARRRAHAHQRHAGLGDLRLARDASQAHGRRSADR